ncbi:MAG: hypothetical protein ACLFRY_03380 [Spirochaetia bacterium]
MRLKICSLFVLLCAVIAIVPAFSADKKIRFAATGGLVLHNEFLGQTPASRAGTAGAGVAFAYPVGTKDRFMNVELAVANWYNLFPYQGDFAHTLRIGFGIRVFLNLFPAVRPYFTHDITTGLVWVSGRQNYATALGVLLGLGVDIPINLSGAGEAEETSSFFVDVSLNLIKASAFTALAEGTEFISASVGYSWLLGGRKRRLQG